MAYSRLFLGSSGAALALCLACGSDFDAISLGGGGNAGAAQTAGAGGVSSAAGATSGGSSGSSANGGTASAGASGAATGSGGSSAGAPAGGTTSTGGTSTGGTSTGGTSTGGTSTGGTSTGGTGMGGTSMGGTGGAADCVTLKAEYSAAVAKARVCDAGSMDECSKSSTLPAIGCGCPTLVNAKSQYTTVAQKLYDQIQAAKCTTGAICNIACLPATVASCALQASAMDTSYVCTSSLAAAN